MSQTTILKNWAAKSCAALRSFWQVLEAMDYGPYGYMTDRITHLNDRITHLEDKIKQYETAGSGQTYAEKL